MERVIRNILALGLMVISILMSSCTTSGVKSVTQVKYPFLAHTGRNDQIVWRTYSGPDFDVFHGQPKTSRNSGFGFYRGGHPSFDPAKAVSPIKGRLGAFDVDWFQTSTSNPVSVRRTAVFDYSTRIVKYKNRDQEYRFVEKIHIWVYGPDEREIESLTEYLEGLQLFREKPQDKIEIR